jgi:hypothetical protein
VDFCSVCGLQLFYFFSVFSKKINVLQVRWLTKTIDKKTACNTEHRPCILAVLAVLVGGLLRLCFLLMICFTAGLCSYPNG